MVSIFHPEARSIALYLGRMNKIKLGGGGGGGGGRYLKLGGGQKSSI